MLATVALDRRFSDLKHPSENMQFSIKSPNAFLWKTGYSREKIESSLQGGKITGDWLICPLGESANAVTIREFIDNPSILVRAVEVPRERFAHIATAPKTPLSVAAMGWLVFSGALFAHFLVTIILGQYAAGIARNLEAAIFFTTLLKGIDALMIAGAITALLGHAHTKVTQGAQAGADHSPIVPESKPEDKEISKPETFE